MSKKEIITIIVLVLIIAFSGWSIYWEGHSGIRTASGRRVGTITYRYRIAQRRHGNSVVWEDVEQESPVYDNNLIRTDEISEATIELDDKTRIELDPESMIMLQLEGDRMKVNFQKGSVLLRRSEIEGADRMEIQAARRKVSIEAGDLRLTRQKGDALTVTSLKGRAELNDGKEVREVVTGQSARISGGVISIWALRLYPLLPPDNHRIFIDTKKATVHFSWRQATALVFEISKRRDFKKLLVRRNISDRRISAELEPGIYYWRLRKRNGSVPGDFSDFRKLRIIRNPPMEVLLPAQGAVFRYVSRPPLIHFAWRKHILALHYILEISDHPDFPKKLEERRVFRTGLGLALSQGTYYWRVRTSGPFRDAVSVSPVRRLRVVKGDKLAQPLPERPLPEARFDARSFAESGILFHWHQDPEIVQADIEIAADHDFQNPILRTHIPDNYLTFRRSLKPGRYFWRVRGRNESGTKSDFSKIVLFRVVKPPPEERPARTEPGAESSGENRAPDSSGVPIAGVDRSPVISAEGEQPVTCARKPPEFPDAPYLLFPPEESVVDMSSKDEIPFEWKKVPGAGDYRLRLFHGGRMVFETKTKVSHYPLRDLTVLDTGKFQWTVEKTVELEGKRRRLQAAGTFTIILSAQNKSPEIKIKE